MQSFLIMSFLALSHIHLNILIFSILIFCMFCFLIGQHFALQVYPNIIVALENFSFNLISTCPSQSTLEATLHQSSSTIQLLSNALTNYRTKVLKESLFILSEFIPRLQQKVIEVVNYMMQPSFIQAWDLPDAAHLYGRGSYNNRRS